MSLVYEGKRWFASGGWQETILVASAWRTGIIPELLRYSAESGAMALSAGELANSLELDERAVWTVLEALSAAGYVERHANHFRLSPRGMELFGPESAGSLGDALSHTLRLMERWATLPEVLRTGEALPRDRFSEGRAGFVKAMDYYALPAVDELVDAVLGRFAQASSMLDVGGGYGTYARAFAARGLRGTLFDLPEVIEAVRAELPAGLETAEGSFLESLPDGPYDLILLANVTHIYAPGDNMALIRRAAERLSGAGALLILDFVRGRSDSAPFFAVNMLVNTERGGTWSEDEYRDWCAAAGLTAFEVLDLEARDAQLMMATREEDLR